MIPLHLYPLGWAQNHLYYFWSECAFPLYQLTITVSHATTAEDNYKLLSFSQHASSQVNDDPK